MDKLFAKSADPGQSPHSADQGLYCLTITLFRGFSTKMVI